MSIITWKDVYATGIKVLDREHQGLIDQINLLYVAVREKKGDAVLTEVLEALEKYTREHFEHEEKLMAAYHYPHLDAHRQKHAELLATVKEMKQRPRVDPDVLARELLKFLRDWLMHHILVIDKAYGPYLEARGGRFVE